MRFAKLNSRARRAELIVEVMDRREVLLADVAVDGLAQLRNVRLVVHRIGAHGRKDVRRGEHRLATKLANPGLGVHAILVSHDRRFLLLDRFLAKAAAGVNVGAEHDAHGVEQPLPILGGHAREQAAILSDLFEEEGGLSHAGLQRVIERALE